MGCPIGARSPSQSGFARPKSSRYASTAAKLGLFDEPDLHRRCSASSNHADFSAFDIITGLVGSGGFSLPFIVFGYLMLRGSMPSWLGLVWIACGILFWLGILPLWFFVGALVFGVRGLITFRTRPHVTHPAPGATRPGRPHRDAIDRARRYTRVLHE